MKLRIAALALALPLSFLTSAANANCSGGPFAGSYVGLDLGMASGRGEFTSPGDPDLSDRDTSFSISGHSGYNLQCGQFVIGIEGDFNYVGLETRGTWSDGAGNPVDLRDKIDFFSTTRARFGLTLDKTTLLYVTAGLAMGEVSHKLTFDAASFEQTDKKWQTGFVVGGGLELLRMDRFVLRAEALYVDLGSKEHEYTITTGGCWPVVCTDTAKWDDSFWVARVGVSYKFDMPVAAHTPLK